VDPGPEEMLSKAESENLAFFMGRFLEGVFVSGCAGSCADLMGDMALLGRLDRRTGTASAEIKSAMLADDFIRRLLSIGMFELAAAEGVVMIIKKVVVGKVVAYKQ